MSGKNNIGEGVNVVEKAKNAIASDAEKESKKIPVDKVNLYGTVNKAKYVAALEQNRSQDNSDDRDWPVWSGVGWSEEHPTSGDIGHEEPNVVLNQENPESEMERRIDELNSKLPLSYTHHEGTDDNWNALDREWKMTSENGVIKTTSVLYVGETPDPESQTIYELFKIQGGSYMLHQKWKTSDGTLIDKTEPKTTEDVNEFVLPVFYSRVDQINQWQEEDNERNQKKIEEDKAKKQADNWMFWYMDQDQGAALFW